MNKSWSDVVSCMQTYTDNSPLNFRIIHVTNIDYGTQSVPDIHQVIKNIILSSDLCINLHISDNQIPDGIYKCINNGLIIFYGTIIDKSINGLAIIDQYIYFPSKTTEYGHLRVMVTFNKDSLDGPCETYYDNGQFKKRYEWKNNVIWFHGPFLTYHANGQLHEIAENINNKFNGPYLTYHANGMIKETMVYIDGAINGPEFEYYANGQLKEDTIYCNGEINGHYLAYYANGRLEKKCNYVNGDMHGKFYGYYDSGQLEHEIIVNNGLLGECISYYKNGKTKEYAMHINGEEHGTLLHFWKTGSINQEAEYIAGKREGLTTVYSKLGVVIIQEMWINDTLDHQIIADCRQSIKKQICEYDAEYKSYNKKLDQDLDLDLYLDLYLDLNLNLDQMNDKKRKYDETHDTCGPDSSDSSDSSDSQTDNKILFKSKCSKKELLKSIINFSSN
jgi:antitoxin component YwqK of YwqJK toxin-antitoxin module